MTFVKTFLAGLVLWVVNVPVGAVERSWYVGINGGLSRLTPDTSNSAFTLEDNSSSAFGALLGIDISNRMSAELGYSNLGSATLSANESIGYTAYSFGALAYVLGNVKDISDREEISAYLRLGLNVIDNQHEIPLDKANNTAIWAGAGIEWSISRHFSLRGEFVSFDGDAQGATLAMIYRPRSSMQSASAATQSHAQPVPQPSAHSSAPENVPLQLDTLPKSASPVESAPFGFAAVDCPAAAPVEPLDAQGCAMFSGIQRGIDFKPGTSQLTQIAQVLVDRLAVALLQYPELVIEVAAHSERFDSADTAKVISRQRAITIAKRLTQQGVPVARLRARAFGNSKPRADESSAGGRRLNNRIELVVLP